MKINTVNITTTISKNQDLSKCNCDLTPNTCDYLCCCDTDCSQDIISIWTNMINGCDICIIYINLVSTSSTSNSFCFNKNMLYKYNRKRGMSEFNMSSDELFCVNYDDSSVMSNFYSLFKNFNITNFNTYVSSVSDPKLRSIIYDSTNLYNLDKNLGLNFLSDQPIQLYNVIKNTKYEQTYFRSSIGPYGECVKNGVVRFWTNIPKFTCRQMFVI